MTTLRRGRARTSFRAASSVGKPAKASRKPSIQRGDGRDVRLRYRIGEQARTLHRRFEQCVRAFARQIDHCHRTRVRGAPASGAQRYASSSASSPSSGLDSSVDVSSGASPGFIGGVNPAAHGVEPVEHSSHHRAQCSTVRRQNLAKAAFTAKDCR